MKTINKEALIKIVSEINHAVPIGFSSITNVNARKTNNPYGEIFKLSKVSAFLGANYSAAVNRVREKEGKETDFVAKPRVWGQKLNENILTHNGKFYLIAKIERARRPVYFYRKDGILKYVSKEKISQFLPEKQIAKTQNLNKEVITRTYDFNNLHSVNLNKQNYKII